MAEKREMKRSVLAKKQQEAGAWRYTTERHDIYSSPNSLLLV
jgi:hypothetical protein